MNYYNKSYQDYSAAILSQEISTISPKKEALLRVALVFPNSYEVGMSNLGFQEVYRLFNAHPEALCERFFLNPPPFHTVFRSIESGREPRDFDVIAFSVSFEMDYPNIVHFLEQVKLAPLATGRNPRDPLIVCGGIVTMLNPAPLAPIMDCFLIGEAEFLIDPLINLLLQHKHHGLKSAECLEELAAGDHRWVPKLEPTPQKKASKDSRQQPIRSCIISPFSHFKNMYLIEVGRACARSCHFCAASEVYRPVKFFDSQTIITAALGNPFQTKRIGLIGSALSDYPNLAEVCRALVAQQCELGLSSFRLDAIDPEFLEILEQGGIRSLTLAPEAGSERLRKLIHKQLTDDQIFSAVEAISKSSISALKFYFMIGLPFELMSDIEAIIILMQKIMRRLNRKYKISISINAFIPKPMTPFQWAPMDSGKNLKHKRKFLTNGLRQFKGVTVVFGNIKGEILQGILSVGNAEVGQRLVQQLAKNGPGEFSLATDENLLEQHLYRPKMVEETLPWDFLLAPQHRISLTQKWQNIVKSLSEESADLKL
jgi:radical SAM superfamily enzyme YgiQ (UPF0313 family)